MPGARTLLLLLPLLCVGASCDELFGDALEQIGGGGALRTVHADPKASHIKISIPKATNEHTAEFHSFDAVADVAGTELRRLEVTIQIASLTTDTPELTADLLDSEFLDVERFPTAHFESTSIEAVDGPFSTHEIAGVMRFHGVEKEVQAKATLAVELTGMSGDAELTIAPESFGIDHPAIEAEMVDEGVTIAIHLEFPFQEASP